VTLGIDVVPTTASDIPDIVVWEDYQMTEFRPKSDGHRGYGYLRYWRELIAAQHGTPDAWWKGNGGQDWPSKPATCRIFEPVALMEFTVALVGAGYASFETMEVGVRYFATSSMADGHTVLISSDAP
jgi:hypothetical protein